MHNWSKQLWYFSSCKVELRQNKCDSFEPKHRAPKEKYRTAVQLILSPPWLVAMVTRGTWQSGGWRKRHRNVVILAQSTLTGIACRVATHDYTTVFACFHIYKITMDTRLYSLKSIIIEQNLSEYNKSEMYTSNAI